MLYGSTYWTVKNYTCIRLVEGKWGSLNGWEVRRESYGWIRVPINKDKMRETARWEEYCTQTTVAIGKRVKPKKTWYRRLRISQHYIT